MKKRLMAILLIALAAAGIFAIGKSGMPVKEKEQQEEASLFDGNNKDSIYLWYTDDALTTYLSSAAVAYNETHDARIVPVLESGLDYVETINRNSVESNVPDLYVISNDALEKAYLAGLAVGYWNSLEEIKENWAIDQTFEPKIDDEQRNKMIKGWNKAVKYAYGWAKED